MEHNHTDAFDPDWPGFSPLSWAPEADPTLNDRAYAACHDECQSCIADLSLEAAQNPQTLAALLNISLGLLVLPDRVPGHAWLEGRLDPHPPLPTIIARIDGMDMNGAAVVGMLEEFATEDRLGIAAAAMNLIEQFFMVLHYSGPVLFIEEHRKE